MRAASIVVCLICPLLFCVAAVAAPPAASANSRTLGLAIRVESGDWGGAQTPQIETVLYDVADALLSRLPQQMTAPILVSHTDSGPVVLYDRGPGGEYLVHLHARGERWSPYAYEFAHELCHIMSNYGANLPADRHKANQWFEETLCETASLYALKRLAATWQTSPPGPEWSQQARPLRSYYELLIGDARRRLPPRTSLAIWLDGNADQLRRNPYLRAKDQLVANLLLPLFDDDPKHWDALSYLNLDPADGRNSFPQYLRNWYEHAPAEHKKFVRGVQDLLEGGAAREHAASGRARTPT